MINRKESTAGELNLVVNNGDLAALQETTRRLGFKDEESMLRFMLAVLSKSATRSVTITDQNGMKIPLTPNDGLLRPDTPPITPSIVVPPPASA